MSTVLITGSSRGIGLALVEEYVRRGAKVIATCRNPDTARDLQALLRTGADIRIEPLDVSDFAGIDDLAERLAGQPIDILINNAGIHGPRDAQAVGKIDFAAFDPVMRVNTLAPLKVAEAFLDSVAASDEKKLVTISSAMGSISGTRGGLYMYRASKAAANMCMATLARDVANRGVVVAVLSPGYVDTDFTRGTSDRQKISPAVSAAGLADVIAGYTMETSGSLQRYNGEVLGW